MGRLPVYLWTDRPWLPYKGTNKSIEQFGFLANLDQLPSLFSQLKQLSLSEEYQPNLLEQLIRSKPNEQETVAEAGNNLCLLIYLSGRVNCSLFREHHSPFAL